MFAHLSIPAWATVFFLASFVFRLGTLAVSKRHEKVLKANDAIEYGAANSNILALMHALFYIAAITEAAFCKRLQARPDNISITGFAVYGFGVVILLYVIRLLGPIWTVKLIISPKHTLVTHPLFRYVRHPNYYLNIIPELVGLALIYHAYWTLGCGLAIYSIPLARRIREEEKVMNETFASAH